MLDPRRVAFEETTAWLVPNNRTEGLEHLCNYVKNVTSVLEIGSSRGISTRVFLKHFDHVTTIDHHYKHGFDANVAEFGHKLNKITGDSIKLSSSIKSESFDLIYLDSIHSYEQVKSEIRAYLPKLKPKGYMTGHDYCYYGIDFYDNSGVIKAVNQILGYPDQIYKDTSWLFEDLHDRELGNVTSKQ